MRCSNTNNKPLEVGTHTLTWTYSKDSSINPAGDFFAISKVSLYIPTFTRGDVNGDGVINVTDVTMLITMAMNETGADNPAADVNGDGLINVTDVTTLITMVINN